MKALRFWFIELAYAALITGLLYLWQWQGIQGAGNAFLAVVWAMVVLGFLITCFGDNKYARNRPPAGGAFVFLRNAALLLAVAWFGLFWLFGCYAFVCIGVGIARKREPKAEALAAAAESPGGRPLCDVPPAGWWCSRERGHSGPCAARQK